MITTDVKMTRNILATYRSAQAEHLSAGQDWYALARDEAQLISDATGVDLERVVVAMAHLSPRTRWARNVSDTWALCKGDPRPSGTLSRSWSQALRALAEPDPWSTFGKRAPKTRAFAQAILGDASAVVVDVWAARVAGVDPKLLSTPAGYERVADAYRRAARREGVTPREMQAITWVAARGRAQ